MKKLFAVAFATLMLASTPTLAEIAQYTKGVVKKLDLKAGKVTIIHEELKNLEMPAMTMVFYVAEEAMLEKLSEGQEIVFVAERLNGKLTVTELAE